MRPLVRLMLGDPYLSRMRITLSFLLLALLLACGPSETQEVEETILKDPVDMAANPDSLLRHAVLFSFQGESYPEGVSR